MSRGALLERIAGNPFHVLGLPLDAPRATVEREGQRILDMMQIDHPGAAEYDSPAGRRRRDADMVRLAMAELRDPDRRLLHELLASLAPVAPEPAGVRVGPAGPWPDASRALGWAP